MATGIDVVSNVRKKYPGAYDDLSDSALLSAIQKKYPGSYDDLYIVKPEIGPFKAIGSLVNKIAPSVDQGGTPISELAKSPEKRNVSSILDRVNNNGGMQGLAQDVLSAAQLAPIGKSPLIGGVYSGTLKAAERLVAGEKPEDALRKGVAEGAIAGSLQGLLGGIGKLGSSAIDKFIGKKLAGLQAGGFNENTLKIVKENPELAFKPKDSWQKTYETVGRLLQSKKTSIGRQIGELKKDAVIKSVEGNLSVDSKSLIDEVDSIPNLAKGTPTYSLINRAKNLIKNGGESTSGKSQEIASLSLDQVTKAKESLIDSFSAMKNSMRSIQSGGKSAESLDRTFAEIIGILGRKEDEIISQIEDGILASGLKGAKSKYGELLRSSRKLGNVIGSDVRGIGAKIENVFSRNQEREFETLKELLPDRLFKKTTAHVIDQGVPRINLKSGFQMGNLITGGLGNIGGAISGNLPEYGIGNIGSGLIRSRQATGQGLSKLLGPLTRAYAASSGQDFPEQLR